MKTYPLDMYFNCICLAIGFGEMPWGLLLKFIDVKYFSCMTIKDAPPEDKKLTGLSSMVRSRSRVFDK